MRSAYPRVIGPSGYYFYDSKVRVRDNLAVGPSDYDPYCITAPRDPRLPGGGGEQCCWTTALVRVVVK